MRAVRLCMHRRERRHRKAPTYWVLVVWLVCLLGCLPQTEFRKQRSTEIVVYPDRAFNRLFSAPDIGWTGGDGTLSIPLPGGRTMWLFGDSFLGRVDADGRRAADTPFIRNCLLIQQDGRLVPRYGRQGGRPVAFFRPASPAEWYWPGDGTVLGDHLAVFLHRFRQARPGLWNWEWIGTDLALLGLPELEIEALRPVEVTNGVRYGAGLLESGNWIWVYGVADTAAGRELHVARSLPKDLGVGAWQFYDGRTWTPAPGDSRALMKGVSSQFSVVPFREGFALITMDARTPFSRRLVAYRSLHPEGPFQGPALIYEAPEASDEVAAYNPFIHDHLTEQGRYLVSYNVNHLHDTEVHFRDAGLYRPRFLRVDLARLFPQRLDAEHGFGGAGDGTAAAPPPDGG